MRDWLKLFEGRGIELRESSSQEDGVSDGSKGDWMATIRSSLSRIQWESVAAILLGHHEQHSHLRRRVFRCNLRYWPPTQLAREADNYAAGLLIDEDQLRSLLDVPAVAALPLEQQITDLAIRLDASILLVACLLANTGLKPMDWCDQAVARFLAHPHYPDQFAYRSYLQSLSGTEPFPQTG
jgi:hypothetical protein